MMLYNVIGVVTRTVDGWTSTVSTPTFVLDGNIQGIVSTEHAERIATDMLQELAPGAEIHVSVSARDN